MPDKTTLSRFPLFGLFTYRAARRMRLLDETSRLLRLTAGRQGCST